MSSNRRQPEQQAPPVQWLRVQYAKRGRARFTSHRDFSRAFDRALRRAGVPMAYSSGFNPHPRVSFANAAPTGAATEAEYLEIGTSEVCDPVLVQQALNDALPTGLSVLAVVAGTKGSLADKLTASCWRVELTGVPDGLIEEIVPQFLAREGVEVQRMTKNGMRSFDARAAVVSAAVEDGGLLLVIRHTTPLVRPDDVLSAMSQVDERFAPDGVLLTRLAQGPLSGDTVGDPLAE
ncbi:TIGR03936 family radical SAM-associated protein [Enemella sp. A6]|uniref:TIGR03936 family radical SAM-associated protein n=1 Tax=Enemella sp. A6 TaxID=3440152 RepID=UPI003EC02D6E